MIQIKGVHHIAIICSDYERSKKFYTEVLGFKITGETYRKERRSFKLDLALGDNYIIELFSFPDPPVRITNPEAAGLRHLAFTVDDLEFTISELRKQNITAESVRTDELTGNLFTFIFDPDGMPVELVELKV